MKPRKSQRSWSRWWHAHGVILLFWAAYLGLMGYGLWEMAR